MKKLSLKKALLLVTAVVSVVIVIPIAINLAAPPPAMPTGLWSYAPDAGNVELNWTDNSTDETGFKIQRATDYDFVRDDTNLPSRAVSELNAAANAVTYLDATTTQHTIYYYRIAAVNGALQSRFSNLSRMATPNSQPFISLVQPTGTTVNLGTGTPTALKANVGSPGSDITGTTFSNGGSSMVGYQLIVDDGPNTWDAQEIYTQFDISVPAPPAGAANNSTTLAAGLPAGTVAEFQIEGTVATVSGNTWTIGSPALTVYQSVNTAFEGARHPVPGDAVEIWARRLAAGGPLVARKIIYREPGPQVLGAPSLDITYLYNGTVDAGGIVGDPDPTDGIIIPTDWTVNGVLFHVDDQQYPAYINDASLGEGSVVTVRFGAHQVRNVARRIYSAVASGIPTPLGATYINGEYLPPNTNNFYAPENLPAGTWLYYIVDGVVTYANHDTGYWIIGEEGYEVYEHVATNVQLKLNDKLPGVGDECIMFCRRSVEPGPLVVDHIHPILQGPLPMKPTGIELHLMYNGAIQAMGPNTWTINGQQFVVDDVEDPASINPFPAASFSVGNVVTVEFDHFGDMMPYDGLWNPMNPLTGISSATLNLDASLGGRTGRLYLQAMDDDQHGNLKVFDAQLLNSNVPGQPQNLTAGLSPAPWDPGVDYVDLDWSDVSGETGYRVYRAPDVSGAPGTFVQIGGNLAANTITYHDTSVAADGTTYWYKVVAFNGNGESAPAVAVITTPEAPVAPSDLQAVLAAGPAVNLTWQDNSNNETGFEVERGDGASPAVWTLLGAPTPTTGAGIASWSDTTVVLGNTYTYRVRAVNAWGASPWDPVTIKVAVPDAPTSLNATAVSPSHINVTWTDASDNERYFIVQRAPDVAGNPGAWAGVSGNLPSGTTSYNDLGLTDGTIYWYRVLAENVLGNSTPSNQDSATTPQIPGAPTALNLLAVAPDQINLSWTENNPDTENGYYISRAPQVTGIPGSWTLIFTTGPDANAYQDTSCAPGTSYYYRVEAFTGGVVSAFVQSGPATTPGLPVLAGSAVNTTTVQLTWADVSYENTYLVERSTDGVIWTAVTVPPLAQNSVSYNDVVPVAGSYRYRLTAQSAYGDFVSNVAIVITLPTNAPLLSVGTIARTSVGLSWLDNSAAETYFYVYRRVAGTTSWTYVTRLASSAGTGTTRTYTVAGLTANRGYEFLVGALVNNLLIYSNTVSATTLP